MINILSDYNSSNNIGAVIDSPSELAVNEVLREWMGSTYKGYIIPARKEDKLPVILNIIADKVDAADRTLDTIINRSHSNRADHQQLEVRIIDLESRVTSLSNLLNKLLEGEIQPKIPIQPVRVESQDRNLEPHL